jgi:type I restriction enzyme S subunit
MNKTLVCKDKLIDDYAAIKPGYKKTKSGWIPEDWLFLKLHQIAELIFSNVDKLSFENEVKVRLCNYTDVYKNKNITNTMNFMMATATENEINRFKLKKGDVLITKDSETADDIGIPALISENLDGVICGYHLAIIRPDRTKLLGEYLNIFFHLHIVKYYLQTIANGVTRFGLSTTSTQNFDIILPPLPEQQKIAEILTTWDNAIEKMDQLIAAKQRLKKGLMQQLLTGKKRFGEFDSNWKICKLGDITKERLETGHISLQLLAITGSSGVVKRETLDKTDTSSEDKSKYKRICIDDIGYNTMRMWQGVSGVSEYEGIISPAYTVVTPNKNISFLFLGYLFKLPQTINKFWRYSQGLVDDTLNLKYHNFLQIHVTVPESNVEQKKIALCLSAIDKEINQLRIKKIVIEKQKKGLMQVLLTGKVRVKL